VADLTPLPGVFEQLKLVAGLRWKTLRNSLRRKSNVWDLVGMIFAGLLSSLLVFGLSVAFFFGARTFSAHGKPSWIGLLYSGVFLWWQLVPVLAAGFGTTFDFRKLLRFPLSLRAFYLLGIGYGFADFAAVASLCWLASILLGILVGDAHLFPLALFVTFLFTAVSVTLERLIGSLLEKLFSKRRAREVFIGIFVLCMVSTNFLGPMFNKYGHQGWPSRDKFLPYVNWLPGSIAGYSLGAAHIGDHAALFREIGWLLLWAAVCSLLLFRRYRSQYFGEELSEGRSPEARKRKQRTAAGDRAFPALLPPPVAAVVYKELCYIFRNGFLLLNLVFPPIMVFFFTMQFGGRHSMLKERGLPPDIFFPAVLGYLMLILLTPAYNSFAYESKGILTYFMAPIRFRHVFLGKNLVLGLLVLLELVLSGTVMYFRIGLPSVPRFVSTITALAFAVMGQLTIANWSSLSFPKKMEIGKMKGQRNSGIAVWTAFGVQILLGAICGFVLFAGSWLGGPWTPSLVFVGLTAIVTAGYVSALDPLERQADAKRELLIETLTR